MTKFSKTIIVIFVFIAIFIGFFLCVNVLSSQPTVRVGSIGDGQAYYSTTTDQTWNQAPFFHIIRAGYGVLGSVVITKSNVAALNIYDATTTDITQRTGNLATTTILIASFPPSATVGTYVFDVQFTRGLIVETPSAGNVVASSTITWR